MLCQLCNHQGPAARGQPAELIRPSLNAFLRKQHPQWDGTGFVCFEDLGQAREAYVKEVLQDELGELTALDQEVVESLREHEIVTSDIEKQFERKLTFGERLSDHMAEFGGSWKFIIAAVVFFNVWVLINAWLAWIGRTGFDPYPYLMLSTAINMLAVLQAPIILMSQNRQAHKDRLRAEIDYQVNLKNELALNEIIERLKTLEREYLQLASDKESE